MQASDLRIAALGALGGILAMTMMAQVPMSIRADGIQFTDGTVQTSAHSRRAFYLTSDPVHDGSQTLTACATGFQMASLLELLDVSNLRYALEVDGAFTAADSGEGPPTGIPAWIRTGQASSGSSTEGMGNCHAWSSNNSIDSGTVAELEEFWDGSNTPPIGWLGPWDPFSATCNFAGRVWCVETAAP